MTVATYEGVVKEGKILFMPEIELPENARVYVVVINVEVDTTKVAKIATPRLVYREDATRFKMQVSEEKYHAEV